MQLVANYEVKSECSMVTDDFILRIKHPKGLYRARFKNIPRTVYTTPFLLSLHLYFEAPSLDEAREIADGHLVNCLNMLAFTTGSRFQRHRIRQIVDASPGAPITTVLMWSDSIEYEDPQPFLDENVARSIERLSEFDIPPRSAAPCGGIDWASIRRFRMINLRTSGLRSRLWPNSRSPSKKSPMRARNAVRHSTVRPARHTRLTGRTQNRPYEPY